MVYKYELEELVKEHGEAHVYVEEHEVVTGGKEAIGIRDNSNCEFKSHAIVMEDGSSEQHVIYDSIVHIELPGEFPD